jgi:hypothetical protein
MMRRPDKPIVELHSRSRQCENLAGDRGRCLRTSRGYRWYNAGLKLRFLESDGPI